MGVAPKQSCATSAQRKEEAMQIGDQVRVVDSGHPFFGQVGVFKGTINPYELDPRRFWPDGVNHMVEFQCSPTPENDNGVRQCMFYERELRRDGQETFWALYSERKAAHHGNTARRANRACNLWRQHRPTEAIDTALSCHAINLALAAMIQPRGFSKTTRLRWESLVSLLINAGKDRREIADIVFHMYLENREVREIRGITPACTCMEQGF